MSITSSKQGSDAAQQAWQKLPSRGGSRAASIVFGDIERALKERAPNFAELVVMYLDQRDPKENAPEEPTEEQAKQPMPDGAMTIRKVRNSQGKWQLWGKSDDEKRAIRKQLWDDLKRAPFAPPRLKFDEVLIGLYEKEDQWSRDALIHIIKNARIGWGVWRGMKSIYKRVEENHDVEMFGVLAYRFEGQFREPSYGMNSRLSSTGEVKGETIGYMQRRAWRYLRQLGNSFPDLFVEYAVQVLRHYPPSHRHYGNCIGNQVWARQDVIDGRWIRGVPEDLKKRACDEAWKKSSAPLFSLLEDSRHPSVCEFAIRSLQKDFESELSDVSVEWLNRLASKRVSTLDKFLVELIQARPEFHGSKLKSLGLHDAAINMMFSGDENARKFGVEYANNYAMDLDTDKLMQLSTVRSEPTKGFVLARLDALSSKELGIDRVVQMLLISSLKSVGQKKLEGFAPADLTEKHYVDLVSSDRRGHELVAEFFKKKQAKIPASYLMAHINSMPSGSAYQYRQILNRLGEYPIHEVGVDWFKKSLLDPRFSGVTSSWLRSGKLTGEALDVEWLKGLVMRQSTRSLAISVLSNTKLVEARRVGLSWLLVMARQTDPALSDFATRYLLANFLPNDFGASGDQKEGVGKLFGLLGAKQKLPVRKFAALYLTVHHPVLGPKTLEAKNFGIEPKMSAEDYQLAGLRDLFSDPIPELRQFVASVAMEEAVRWGDKNLVYELANSKFSESRRVAKRLFLGDTVPKEMLLTWLTPAQVFALTESSRKATREIGLNLIRQHYDHLGGTQKLAWLMESPDREVRLFAVRLVWDQFRKGRTEVEAKDQLKKFLRMVLFGLPPGRMERRDAGDDLNERSIPASVAKRRLVAVVRDMSVENETFAKVATPIFIEFMYSTAVGEWQACAAALARIRASHPSIETTLPEAVGPFQRETDARAQEVAE